MNEELKQLAKLHDENIELKKEIQRLRETMDYTMSQIRKDRNRIKTMAFVKKALNKKFEIIELIDETPIILD